jgi:hypothetical protein
MVRFEMGKKTDLRRGGETPYLGLFSTMLSHYFVFHFLLVDEDNRGCLLDNTRCLGTNPVVG